MANTTTDFSERYVASPGDVLSGNLACLWAVDAALACQIEQAEPYPLEKARSGEWTVSVPTPDGRQVYLHSRHRPLEETRRLIDGVKTDACVAFYLQGLGLGYGLQLLYERISDEAIICVLEPDIRLIRTALEALDLQESIRSGRVLFITRDDKADLFGRLEEHSALLTLGFEAVVHAPSLQRYPEFYRTMQAQFVELAGFYRTSLQTLIINGRRTSQNLARNIGWYAANPGLGRLKDRYAGKPAIIVSAGPSLRKNAHLLREAHGKAVLIAVQTSLKPMLEMGVEPTFVTSLDYSDICTRFFEKIPQGISTELVAEPKATDKIFGMYPGKMTLLGNAFAESLLREMNLGRATLRAGATVAHLSYYLAEYLGCDPIIFVGQDLGFSDGMCYAPGTSYEDVWRCELSSFCTLEMKQWEQIVRDRQILRRVDDVNGNKIYTEERLYSYLQQFERDFANSHATVIDASEGGVRKEHSQVMTLREALDLHCQAPLPVASEDHSGMAWTRLTQTLECLERRRDEARKIEAIGERTLPLLRELLESLEDQPRANGLIAQLDALRREINPLLPTLDLILSLTQSSELRKFQEDRLIAASGVEGIQRQRRQTQRDIDNVVSVNAAAIEFAELLEEVIATLQAKQNRSEAA